MTRYATVVTGDVTRAAVVVGDEFEFLPYSDAAEAAVAGVGVGDGDGERFSIDEVTLAPPTIRPRKIICVGLNYRGHIHEMQRETPVHPTLFAKYDRALIGARDPLELPGSSTQVDWEAELGVVIGSEARHVTASSALAHVAGYTVVNDVSMRDWQRRSSQWLSGKTFESSTPIGPILVTPDEVDHARDLLIECWVDDTLVQRSRTSDMVFDTAALIAYISSIITLDPGDLIATGTPSGVGAGRKPARYLSAGQQLRTRIEGIGELVNLCR